MPPAGEGGGAGVPDALCLLCVAVLQGLDVGAGRRQTLVQLLHHSFQGTAVVCPSCYVMVCVIRRVASLKGKVGDVMFLRHCVSQLGGGLVVGGSDPFLQTIHTGSQLLDHSLLMGQEPLLTPQILQLFPQLVSH